jgi:hypothetical protein
MRELIDKIPKYLQEVRQFVTKVAKNPMGFYLIWVISHYVCVHMYVTYCAPLGIKGFFTSIFMTSTHVCHGLSWIIYQGGHLLFHMWVLLGGWIMTNIIRLVYKEE